MKRITSVAVVGAGYMGGGIAQSLAISGFDVVIADVSAPVAQSHRDRLVVETRQFEREGLFEEGAAEQLEARLVAADSITEAVAEADFIEEAVTEVPAVKRDVLGVISAAARREAIIGSNTSTIPVHVMADAVVHPERFLTVHWSNPAPFIPGVELVVGEDTDPRALDLVQDLLRRAGRIGALVADRPGFVLNRLQYVLLKEAMMIVEEGVATPKDVDTIVSTTFGFRLPFFGPFTIADMAGLDVYRNGFKILEEGLGERFKAPDLLESAVAAGRYGTKNGCGLNGDYDADQVDALIKYRSTAYSRMAHLLRELPPGPTAAPSS